MPEPRGGEREDARAVALADELAAQLGRLKGAGPKIKQFLSMVQLDRPPDDERSRPALGAVPDGARTIPFGDVRRVIEHDLDDRIGRLFDDIDEEPFAVASLGQVHRASTSDGEIVAVKVQHPGVAGAIESDLRNLGLVGPIIKRLAPELDAGACWPRSATGSPTSSTTRRRPSTSAALSDCCVAIRTSGCHTCTRTSRRAAYS